MYRNKNGIAIQLGCIKYILTDGKHGFSHGSKVYEEIVHIYQNNPDKFYKILEQAQYIAD